MKEMLTEEERLEIKKKTVARIILRLRVPVIVIV